MKVVHGTEPGASAAFSENELHRYMLERQISDAEPCRVLFCCGLNPSTADAFKVDPTVRREISFGRLWGCTQYLKGNAYGWRDKKPANMWRARKAGHDIVGALNDACIASMLVAVRDRGGIALACWGAHAEHDRVMALVELAADVGVRWQCLGTNKDGSPKHPLYLAADTPLRPWS